jgi:hypothetical protein
MHQVSRKLVLFIMTPLQNLVVTRKLFHFIKVYTTSVKIYAKVEAHTLLKTWWDSTQLPGTWLIVPPRQITHQVHLSHTQGLMRELLPWVPRKLEFDKMNMDD